MKILIVGSGNVAHILARSIVASDRLTLIGIYARNEFQGKKLAAETDSQFYESSSKLPDDLDVVIIAVSDNAIKISIPKTLHTSTLIVHTAGAISINVLDEYPLFGVLYPVQSLLSHLPIPTEITYLYNANTDVGRIKLRNLTEALNSKAYIGTDEERLKYHLAAVLVNNFVNHIHTLASDYIKNNGLDFSTLYPLINETFLRSITGDPESYQTGPAKRKDIVTIEKHRKLLSKDTNLLQVYDALTSSISEIDQ